jgi:outer membrane protein insertion porin family
MRRGKKILGQFFSPLVLISIGVLIGIQAVYPRSAQAQFTGNPLASNLEIDRVEVLGVDALNSSQIERVLKINSGDKLERVKVLQSEEAIQAFYRLHGFPEVKIQSRLVRKKNRNGLFETVLEFQIIEGLPLRIAAVQFVVEAPLDETNERIWKKTKGKILSKLALNYGDLFDQEKIADSSRVVQEFLISESYVGARVTEVGERIVEAPSNQGKVKNFQASKWLELNFRVDLGDRVNFGFRGNSFFTYSQLMNLVDEQRLLGLGKDYVGVIKNRLEEEYRSVGYFFVKITPFTFENLQGEGRKVTYVVDEGPRAKIESIDFDGNVVFPSFELREKFFAKANGLVQNRTYVERDVQKAAEILIDWMKSRGYLSARLVTINRQVSPRPSRRESDSGLYRNVKLLLYIYEGDQTILRKVSIQGAHVFETEYLKHTLQLEENSALNLYHLVDGIDQLKKMYHAKGYLNFRLLNEGTDDLAKYSQENKSVEITLDLDEGPQFKVTRIDLEGLENTKEFVVRREIPLNEGDVLTTSKLNEIERNLRRLGIFSNVAIRTLDDPNLENGKIVRIILKEADRGVVSGGPGYRNDLGVRAFGQLAYTNLWGEDHTASVNLAVNRRFYKYNFLEGQAQVAYVWPWFLVKELTFRPFISFGAVQYMKVKDSALNVNFGQKTLTLAGSWQKQLLSSPNLVGEFGYTFESIDQFMSFNPGDDNKMTIGTLTPKLSIDRRDNPLNPISGYFGTTWVDYAMPFLGTSSDIGYYRIQLRADYYVPLLPDIVFYASFRSGYEKTLQPTSSGKDSIPFTKQFTLGGIGSLRGYQLQEINKEGEFHGKSLSYVNYRTELGLPFAGALKLALFVEAGNLFQDSYSLGSLLYDYGFGFHYMTPVGPVSFDIGFKVNPEPNAAWSTFNFSVGVI